MALLFDEAQGAFKDTGSQASPMKKQTGLMRKQMSKMDEVAPRGHTLAYITPEEAQILNKGGGGVDAQGNQMTGPYGVPMYQGFVDRFRRSSTPVPMPTASRAPPGEKGGGGYIAPSKPLEVTVPIDISDVPYVNPAKRPKGMPSMLSYDKPLEVTVPLPSQTGEAPPGEKGGGGYIAPTKFVDRQKKARDAQTDEKKKTEFVDRQKKTREAQKKETIKKVEDETPMDSGEFLKEWWKKREEEKKRLLPVEKPTIRIAEFNPDRFNRKLGNMIGGVYGNWLLWNPSTLGNLTSTYGVEIDKILSDREKGEGMLYWKGGQSKNIIEFLQENAPENESQKQQMINMLNRLPQNIQDNIKKAVSEGEISLDVVAVKPFMDGVTKLASGDLILDDLPEEFQVASTGSLRGLL